MKQLYRRLLRFYIGAMIRKAGMYRAFHGISTRVVPADLELYRSLLPQPFSMPQHPLVVLFVVNYTKVFPWPMPTYLEASISLSSTLHGEESWHVLTMPVTEKLPMMGGRAMGFPKYVADEIRLDKMGDKWCGEEIHEGANRLRLEFKPGITRELEQWEQEFWNDPAFFPPAVHQLMPPGVGPNVIRVKLDHLVPPCWSPTMGMVSVTIGTGMPWAGLVPTGTVVPGTFNQFVGRANLVPERLASTDQLA